MTPPSELMDLAAELCDRALAAGTTDAEVYIRRRPLARITLQRGSTSRSLGWETDLALRAWHGDRMAIATTNDLSATGVRELVARVVIDARDGVHAAPRFPGPGRGTAAPPPGDDSPIGTLEHVDALESLMDRLAERLPDRSTILSASYSGERPWTALVNTRGFVGAHCSERHVLWLWMENDDGNAVIGASGLRFADLDMEAAGDALVERARSASAPATGVADSACPTLLPPAAAADLARALGGLLTGAQAVATAQLRQQLGRVIAASTLTLVDDATLPGALLSRPFDDEGTATERTRLIERGVLRSVLNTRESAELLGTSPNGKASRPELWDMPRSAHSNLYFEAGESSPAALRDELGRGLAVTAVQRAGQISAGRFALVGDGWWLERGRPVRRVAGARLSLNVFELLRGVRACGDDLRFSPLAHGAGSPSLLVERMDVA